jgi:cytoskeletal protein RodZ
MSPDRPPDDFGARLREARERRGVSLRQIANATKISVGVLEALERNDIARLPGGIFGRAFVRSYAIEVGLDPEATIQDFVAQFPHESVTVGHPTPERSDDNALFESERRTAGTFLSLLVVSIPIAGVVLYFGTAGRRAVRDAPAPTTVEASAPVSDPKPVDASAPTSGTSVPAVRAAEAVKAEPQPAVSPTPPAADPTPAADNRLTIALSAKRPCWVSATVDGQKVVDRLLQAGERKTIEVRREMELTAGDASAIAMTINGSDARSLGKAGEVVTARLNMTNFKEFLQAR